MKEFDLDGGLLLRQFEDADADVLFRTVKANYDHLRTFLHWVVPEFSLESSKRFIIDCAESAENGDSTSYGIFLNDEFAGVISWFHLDKHSRRMEIGYWIAAKFEGSGIITRSCKMLIDHAFDELDLNRIEIRCATENVRSRAIPERLGFKLEGVLRESEWRHTRFYDMAIYGLLRNEWKEAN